MGQLKHFTPDELIVDRAEAWKILVWFFGGNSGITIGDLTDNDMSFAQALIIEAVDASEDVGWIYTLWRSTVTPPKDLGSLFKKLVRNLVKEWLKHSKPKDFDDPTIYTMVKNTLTRNWRSAWSIRIQTGDPVY